MCVCRGGIRGRGQAVGNGPEIPRQGYYYQSTQLSLLLHANELVIGAKQGSLLHRELAAQDADFNKKPPEGGFSIQS
jgi:hypothetical protein